MADTEARELRKKAVNLIVAGIVMMTPLVVLGAVSLNKRGKV